MNTKLLSRTLFFLLLLLVACNDDEPSAEEQLEAALQDCCSNEMFIDSIGEAKFLLPNLFTPNNDGVNDCFYVFHNQENLKYTQVEFFTADGELVFNDLESFQVYKRWCGPKNNATNQDKAVEGMITYKISVETDENLFKTLEGTVCSYPCMEDSPTLENADQCVTELAILQGWNFLNWEWNNSVGPPENADDGSPFWMESCLD